MAQQPTLTKFLGISPNRVTFDGQAIRAENVDLSGGGLKPVKAPSFEALGALGEIVYHDNEWVSGDENYISTDIEGIPALIYKSAQGMWKINMSNLSSADLWIPAPVGLSADQASLDTPPTAKIEESGTGNIEPGDYEYFTRLIQVDSNGKTTRESLFSNAFSISISSGRVKITRPEVSSFPDRAKWQIFRRKAGENYANLVEEVSSIVAVIYDDKADNYLGESLYPESVVTTEKDYRYVAVWVRDFGGWEHESVPSKVLSVHQSNSGVKLKLTDVPPTGVTAWRLYRISLGADPTTTFQLVDEIAVGTKEYTDTKENVELGGALESSYRADNGALVTAGVPDDQFTGMAGPFNGFFVGWIGRDLYLSQQGNPTWWPGAFVVEANYNIVGVSQVGGNIAVVTEGGVQFGYGVDPEAFTLSQGIFGPGGSHAKAISKNIYLAHSGIYSVSEKGVELLTKGFSKDYFDSLTVISMVYEVDKIILFHSNGALMLDYKGSQWTTLSPREHQFISTYAHGGHIYGLRNSGVIVKIFGSNDPMTIDYESTVDFSESYTKRIGTIKFKGTGDIRVELKAIEDPDTVDVAGDVELDSAYWGDKSISTPSWLDTEAIRYRISGKAMVRAMLFEIDKGSTET